MLHVEHTFTPGRTPPAEPTAPPRRSAFHESPGRTTPPPPGPFVDRWPRSGAEEPVGETCRDCGAETEEVPEVPGLRRCTACRERNRRS